MTQLRCAHRIAILFLLSQSLVLPATLLFAPGNAETVEGNSNNSLPFAGTVSSPNTNVRYQQWYSSNLFSALPSPMWITAIAFRPNESNGNATHVGEDYIADVEIRFSTTQATNVLSSNFATNVGNDQTLVFDGRFDYSPRQATSGPARPFVYVITLMTPFFYDPSAGNLLMDVHNISGLTGVVGNMDAAFNDNFGRAWARSGNGGLPTADMTEARFGLVTRFTLADTAAPVPEPSASVLLGLGISALAWLHQRRGKCG